MNPSNENLHPFPRSSGEIVRALEFAALPEETPGVRIGNYKLLQKIGEGGFGVVWMAEQEEPVRRRVALKIIKPGMDTREVIARFGAERQALALMEHPNIARVFDAGATAAERPYFVMELVRGVPITRYCDENRLSPEARLRLFVSVCQAVQHAHQKGVIHRDLKPSNILVTLHDGVPVPKIIDFGIAKAVQGRLTDKTLFTQFHAFVGTPVYASPEQMEMSGLDVDTRSDIYGLGVLLYELLAGRPPFDPDALAKSGLEAMRWTIREVDPPRPSHRLGTLSEADRTSVAHQRGTDVAKLTLQLRGDVDWIVMHCLEKDRTRRYETAAALAADIQHYLRSEPVTARPPSQLYRMNKFVRRHRVGVAAVATIALLLVGGLITSSTLFVRERAARERAVVAEQSESRLRQEAETARAAEAKRASRTSQALAEQMLGEGRISEGLAHLVRAARSDPDNHALGPRLISALAYRSFAEEVGEPIERVRWACYSNSGRRFTTFGDYGDNVAHVWDLSTGKQVFTINVGNSTGNSGAESRDGRLLAVGTVEGNVNIWDADTGWFVLGPLRHQGRIDAVAFSPDGRWLVTGSLDKTARIWDTTTGEQKAVLPHESSVSAVTVSPDGSRVFTGALRGWGRIWRLPDGEPLTPPLQLDEPSSTSGSFSPDGKLLLMGSNKTACLFDATTGTEAGARLKYDAPCDDWRFTHDGKKYATALANGEALIWELPSGKLLVPSLRHANGRLGRMFFTPDDRFLVTLDLTAGAVHVWNVASGQPTIQPIHTGEISLLDLAPDGREILTVGRDHMMRRWRIAPGGITPLTIAGAPDRLTSRLDPVSMGAVWDFYPNRMQKIDLLTGREIGPPRYFPTPIIARTGAPQMSPNGRFLYVATATGAPELWDLAGDTILRHRLAGLVSTDVTKFSPDSTRLASWDSYELRVWDCATGALVAGPFENTTRSFALSPDGRLLAMAKTDYPAVIWDLVAHSEVGMPLRHVRGITSMVFSGGDRLVATAGGGDATARLWDVRSSQPVGLALRHRSSVRGVAFTGDNRRLLTWTGKEVRLWDVATGAPLTESFVTGQELTNVAFDASDARIATWDAKGGDVRVWDSLSGRMLCDPIPAKSSADTYDAYDCAFHPSGRYLVLTRSHAGAPVVWPLPEAPAGRTVPGWLLRLATGLAGGEIDQDAVFREQAFDAKAFDEIRRELAALPADAPYAEWGRWILADRASRPIGPGFTITAAEAEKLAADLTAPSTPDG